MFRFIAACAVALACLSPAAAQPNRVALVIGNGDYQHAPAVKTSEHDAADLGAALARMGFSVTSLSNASNEAMDRALTAFGQTAKSADIALVFYAGHAIQTGGDAWLIPVDARTDSLLAIRSSAFRLDRVTAAVAGAAKFGVVLIDAARNDPFPAGKTQDKPKLLVVESEPQPKDILVAFATASGQKTVEAKGRNSAFTAALLAHIETPGQDIVQLMRRVRNDVLAATGGKQIPFSHATLSGDQFLTPR
ncbi:caspase family protein [Pseudorhodoplanes sp.]|uniref:caspase family protein n=1 Tax=Pseudorhodoplanes sp. TaxID=1934341 RepID=UPI003D09B35C